MSHASCTQKLVFPFKSAPALTNVRRCSNLDSTLECCLFVCLQEFPHPKYMHLVLHLLGAERPASKRPFFSNQAFAPACVSNQAVGRQVHPAKACCEILWLSWSPTHCCELQNGGFCQSFTFLLRRHRIKFSETF